MYILCGCHIEFHDHDPSVAVTLKVYDWHEADYLVLVTKHCVSKV
jgi:hypothetical protein